MNTVNTPFATNEGPHKHVAVARDAQRQPLRAKVPRRLEREHGFEPLRVEGALPRDLEGTYLRNGPSVFDKGPDQHWFDANGAVAGVRLSAGQALGAVRETHTPSSDHDRGRLRPRYAGFAQRMAPGQRLRSLFGAPAVGNAANINVMVWQQRMYALHESALPVELDPETLQSMAESDLGGVVRGALNAHPRRVPSRGATYHFGFRVGPRCYLDVYELPDAGKARRLTSVPMPFATEVHDCLATERHLIFLVAPLGASSLRLVAKGAFIDALVERPGEPMRIFVVPIDDPERVAVVEADPFFSFHGFNAFEQGTELVFDLVRYPNFGAVHAHILATPRGQADVRLSSDVVRMRVDPVQRRVRRELVSSRNCEFPRVVAASHGRRHRHGWAAGFDSAHDGYGWFDRLLSFDFDSGEVRVIDPGPDTVVGEPELIRRSEREDDVWVLSLLGDIRRGASCLAVWDGLAQGDEPVARIWFDQLLPFGLHGCFHQR